MVSQGGPEVSYGASPIGGLNDTSDPSPASLDRSATEQSHIVGAAFALRDGISRLFRLLEGAPGDPIPMTPERIVEIREARGLTQAGLARLLRLGAHGKRTVARWESGGPVPGPVSVALEALGDGWSPGDGRWQDLRDEFVTVLEVIKSAVLDAQTRIEAQGSSEDGG